MRKNDESARNGHGCAGKDMSLTSTGLANLIF